MLLIKVWLQFDDLKTLICQPGTEILSKKSCQVPALAKLLRVGYPQENSMIYRFFSGIYKHTKWEMKFSDVDSLFLLLCKATHFWHYLFLYYVLLLFNVQFDDCFQKQVQTFPRARKSQAHQHVMTLFSQGCHKFHFWDNAQKEAAINRPNCSKIGEALDSFLSRS